MNTVVGVGVDLTQHVPLVCRAIVPNECLQGTPVEAERLAKHWPPNLEVHDSFRRQLPAALLPLMPGEPLLVGEAAAAHRRGSGLSWPPEAQVPFSSDPACGVARVPLVAAWASLSPRDSSGGTMMARDDHDFQWSPDRRYSARASDILGRSLVAYLRAAGVLVGTFRVGIVVPDELDEVGQQFLLDSLAQGGLLAERVHLIPRPIAVAVCWCQSVKHGARDPAVTGQRGVQGESTVRVQTMSMDRWEAVVLRLESHQQQGQSWLLPVRDRSGIEGALPESQIDGASVALALIRAHVDEGPLAWWLPLIMSDWLDRRIHSHEPLSVNEELSLEKIGWSKLMEVLRADAGSLETLQPLWTRVLDAASPLRGTFSGVWSRQEELLEAASLPCQTILADGTFAGMRMSSEGSLAQRLSGDHRERRGGYEAAVRGAAITAAALSFGLPCYREVLHPLNLYVTERDQFGDRKAKWADLVPSSTVEAGMTWRSPKPITGMQILKGSNHLLLPLRRQVGGAPSYRQVRTELSKPSSRDESVHIIVEVTPGQGFARVRIESETPGVFNARLDWRTMSRGDEPQPQPLAYFTGVSQVVPDEEMFKSARPAMTAARDALKDSPESMLIEALRRVVRLLNKWPLAHYVESTRGRLVEKDFNRHYGVIGSDGDLDRLPMPSLVRDFQSGIGRRFLALRRLRNVRSQLGSVLLRAGGWLYRAIPNECMEYLRALISSRRINVDDFSVVDLHAIGLAFSEPIDLNKFIPLVAVALTSRETRKNNWLRALRNICRFRNHALHPDVVATATLNNIIDLVRQMMVAQVAGGSSNPVIFRNCLELIPFLLKRRRYEPGFLPPRSPLGRQLIELLERIDADRALRPTGRLHAVPMSTVKFLRMIATMSDLENLLGIGGDDDDD